MKVLTKSLFEHGQFFLDVFFPFFTIPFSRMRNSDAQALRSRLDVKYQTRCPCNVDASMRWSGMEDCVVTTFIDCKMLLTACFVDVLGIKRESEILRLILLSMVAHLTTIIAM